jgi:hypothetical protein
MKARHTPRLLPSHHPRTGDRSIGFGCGFEHGGNSSRVRLNSVQRMRSSWVCVGVVFALAVGACSDSSVARVEPLPGPLVAEVSPTTAIGEDLQDVDPGDGSHEEGDAGRSDADERAVKPDYCGSQDVGLFGAEAGGLSDVAVVVMNVGAQSCVLAPFAVLVGAGTDLGVDLAPKTGLKPVDETLVPGGQRVIVIEGGATTCGPGTEFYGFVPLSFTGEPGSAGAISTAEAAAVSSCATTFVAPRDELIWEADAPVIDGPLVRRPAYLPSIRPDSVDAETGGLVGFVGECLSLSGQAAIWPAGVRWYPEISAVVDASGAIFTLGNTVTATGSDTRTVAQASDAVSGVWRACGFADASPVVSLATNTVFGQ